MWRQLIGAGADAVWAGVKWLVRGIAGEVRWTAPPWAGWLGRCALSTGRWLWGHKKITAIALSAVIITGTGLRSGMQWWNARPKPVEIAVSVQAPRITDYENNGAPHPLQVDFGASVAPLAAVGKPVSSGVRIEPAIDGTWEWASDRALKFQPRDDWKIGTAYKIGLDKGLVAAHIRLAKTALALQTPGFTARVEKTQFYQDPVNPAVKKAVFDLVFSHPVDPAQLEKRVELRLKGHKEGILGVGREAAKFSVIYDKIKLRASVHSDSLPLMEDGSSATLTLAKGMQAARGGSAFEQALTAEVAIPNLYSLSVSSVEQQVVFNDANEPEQMLMVNASHAVHERDTAKHISAWVLPEHHPDTKPAERTTPYEWSVDRIGKVTEALLKDHTRLKLDAFAAEREWTESHAFKYRADVGRSVYVRIDKGLRSFGGFILRDRQHFVVKVPPFPPQLKFLGDGALLTLSGEKKTALLVRDLPGVKLEIARVLPGQLHHLVSQTTGAFQKPEFNYGLQPDHLTERFERAIPLNTPRGKAHFQPLDLGEYLKQPGEAGQLGQGGGRMGVFLLRAQGYDPKAEKMAQEAAAKQAKGVPRGAAPAPAEPEQNSEENHAGGGGGSGNSGGSGAEPRDPNDPPGEPGQYADTRLIVVTDLGLMVKRAIDGTQDAFVQSIATGLPLADATVEVLGRNGAVIQSGKTGADGRATLGKLDGFTREKAPLMYVVKRGADVSFLPVGRRDRGLDYSRFDVGGEPNPRSAEQLRSYLFSERGIYRPGDPFRIGVIVKPADWQQPVAGMPLEIEVVDPRGLTVRKEKIRLGTGGFNEFEHPTQETSPTGVWRINLYITSDGSAYQQIGSTSVTLREFLPDRMKVSAQLSSEAIDGWVKPKDLKALINAQNLFGTAADNRRVEAKMTLTPAFPSFRAFPDFSFYDPQRAKEGFDEALADQTTDAKGEAAFSLPLERFAKATYRLHLLARVFEPEGGRGVAAETASLVSELDYLIGFKPDGDLAYVSQGAKRTAALIALGPNGKRLEVKQLKAEWYERKHVSVLTKQGNGTYRYESRLREVSLSSQPLAISAAGITLALASAKPGNYVYVIRDANGVELNRIAYSVAGNGSLARSLERNAELQLTLNKKDYAAGDEIAISVRAPYAGAGLITIERERVHAHAWFKAGTESSVQKIKLPKEFEGNGYVSVQFVRDIGSSEILVSPLSYGVVPFAVSRAARTNALTLQAPALVKPGQTVKFKLTSAEAARAVVYAVDEGILQVARYQAPDPLAQFYQKRALEVKSFQILDLILPEFKKLLAASAPGGDAEALLGKNLNPFKRKRDKPAVFWSGIVDVKGEREFSYTVPDTFNGSLKVYAVAVSDTRIGVAQGKTVVRGDFVITPNVPLAAAPGDEFEISAGIANNVAGSGKDAAVTVTLATSPTLEVAGDKSIKLAIGEMREGVVKFRIKVKNPAQAKLGSASLTFSASLTGKDGAKSAQLATDLSVRPASAFETHIAFGNFKGKSELALERNLYPEFRRVEVSASVLPLGLFAGLSSYLGDYAHLCSEQLTSRAFGEMVARANPDWSGAPVAGKLTPAAAAAAGQPAAAAPDTAGLIAVLRSRQNAEGGFGMWSAAVKEDEFISAYVMHYLLEARERGAQVPPDMLKLGLGYLERLAATRPATLPEARVRAHAAYLLTRNATVTTAMLTQIREAMEAREPALWRNDLTAAYLAASYKLLKQDRLAADLMDPPYKKLGVIPAAYAHAAFFDPSMEKNMTLYLVSRHFPELAKAVKPEVWTAVVAPLQQGFYNTLSISTTLLALDAYAKTVGAGDSPRVALIEVAKDGNERRLPAATASLVARADLAAGAARLKLSVDAPLNAYYALVQAGFERSAPAVEIRQGLEVSRELVDAAGNPLTALKVGDEAFVRLRLRASGGSVANVTVVDVLPGGLEPVLGSEPGGENAKRPRSKIAVTGSLAADYIDVREDRVVIYATAGTSVGELTYRVRAVNAGQYTVPPLFAEAMYDRRILARTLGGTLKVEAR